MPKSTVLLLVVVTNIISPPCRLHEQHRVAVSNRNILKPCLPLVRVPGMFLQYRFYLLDGRRILLLKDLVSDYCREHVAGDIPGQGGGYGKTDRYEAGE